MFMLFMVALNNVPLSKIFLQALLSMSWKKSIRSAMLDRMIRHWKQTVWGRTGSCADVIIHSVLIGIGNDSLPVW